MADSPSPLEDALHVVVGAAVLGINRFHAERHRFEEWLDRIAAELDDHGRTPDPS
ncbi:MAG: hypothetical protein AB7H43_04245 [Acidimicrobiia bacterium]